MKDLMRNLANTPCFIWRLWDRIETYRKISWGGQHKVSQVLMKDYSFLFIFFPFSSYLSFLEVFFFVYHLTEFWPGVNKIGDDTEDTGVCEKCGEKCSFKFESCRYFLRLQLQKLFLLFFFVKLHRFMLLIEHWTR